MCFLKVLVCCLIVVIGPWRACCVLFCLARIVFCCLGRLIVLVGLGWFCFGFGVDLLVLCCDIGRLGRNLVVVFVVVVVFIVLVGLVGLVVRVGCCFV